MGGTTAEEFLVHRWDVSSLPGEANRSVLLPWRGPKQPPGMGAPSTRGKPPLVSAQGESQVAACSWSFLLEDACYLGSLQRRAPRLPPRMGAPFR